MSDDTTGPNWASQLADLEPGDYIEISTRGADDETAIVLFRCVEGAYLQYTACVIPPALGRPIPVEMAILIEDLTILDVEPDVQMGGPNG